MEKMTCEECDKEVEVESKDDEQWRDGSCIKCIEKRRKELDY